LAVARRLGRKEPWLSGQKSTLAFLAGAAVALAIPAVLQGVVYRFVGIKLGPGVPAAVDVFGCAEALPFWLLRRRYWLLFHTGEELDRIPLDTERDEKITKPGLPEIVAEILSNCDHVKIEISDTGRGMTRETQARVCEPFFSTSPKAVPSGYPS
jgi:hypothetical protein